MTASADRDITTRETVILLGRTLRFVWPWRYQIGVKLMLALIGISVILYLPWPLKILIDHVVMGMPLGESPTPFPPYVEPFVDALEGLAPIEIVWVVAGVSLIGVLLIGAFGASGSSRDRAHANLAEGLDTATQSENQANESSSRASGLIGLFEYYYQLRVTHRINHRLRSLLFERLMALPLTRYFDASAGDTVYRVMYDTPAISRVCYDVLVLPFTSFFAIAVVIWTAEYSFEAVPSVIWVAWLAAPLVFFTSLAMTGLARRRSLASRTAGAATTATAEEGMTNILAVQSLGANARQRDDFERDSESSFGGFRRYVWVAALFVGAQAAIAGALCLYVLFDVTAALVDGRMSAGDFGLLITYFLQLVMNAALIGSLWFNLQDKIAGMRRVFQIIDLPGEIDDHGTTETRLDRVHLEVSHCTYDYPDGYRALDNVSMSGAKGEMIALVGPTGAGKTTLAYLLPGFIHPSQGQVLINGIDIRELEVDHLRELVTFVFQEPFMFDDTIGNNIRLGNPAATDEDIAEAATTAGAMDFIERLPAGLDTPVGRNGATLSVGQKHRLAIARGLVSRSPVLVLDEPTSALDPETEAALIAALRHERSARLLIVIAHRLSTIRAADRIYFMEEGRIVEEGSHEELMRRPRGAYRDFVALQPAAAPT